VNLSEKRRQNSMQALLDANGLYHAIELPDGRHLPGVMTLEWQRARMAAFGLPDDLRGKTVLDIGPWDGFYTFEMERRGAEVTAVDYVDQDTFRELHRAFQSKAKYLRLDVYELEPSRVGTFDIVLCLGALYHFKHPLLALEKVLSVTRDVCIVDTFVVDGIKRGQGIKPQIPYLEFYEYGELGGQLDNWCGPTVCAVEALVRAAGFARAEVRRVTEASVCVAAHRRWLDLPSDEEPAVELLGLSSHANRGRSFHSSKEEYLQLWCKWEAQDPPALDTVFPEVDGFGVAPLACSITVHGLLVTVRVPPGLAAGRHEARVKIGRSGWSRTAEFLLDLPPVTDAPVLLSLQDSVTWKKDEVDWSNGGWMTAWLNGLSAEADGGNTFIEIGGVPHWPEAVTAGQVNIRLRPVIRAGSYDVVVVHRGARTAPLRVENTGEGPPIRGLETLREDSTSKNLP
jgi:tRNA (mo5U34)-methyltransferase